MKLEYFPDFALSDSTKEKIGEFADTLKDGWHYGEGLTFSENVVKAALRINEYARTQSFQTDALPGINGDIIVVLYNKNEDLEVSVNSDSTFGYSHIVDNKTIQERESITYADLTLAIAEFRGQKCSSIDSFTKNTSNYIGNSLLGEPSGTIGMESQLYPRAV